MPAGLRDWSFNAEAIRHDIDTAIEPMMPTIMKA